MVEKAKYKTLKLDKGSELLLMGIFLMILGTISDFIQFIVSINLPILRYCIFLGSFFYLSKGIIYSLGYNKFNLQLKIIVFSFLVCIIISLIRSIPKIFEGENNFVLFKKLISEDLVLLVLPFLILIKPNLYFYKRLIYYCYRMSFTGFIVIPFVFVLFKLKPAYGTEFLTKLFISSGSIILLTAIYHPWRKIFLILSASAFSLVILLLFARRNMIVYATAVLFLSLFNYFFTSYLDRSKKKYSIILLLIISCFIGTIFFIFKDNFALTLERFNSGFDSRESIISEFSDDFNSHPLDWIFGRGLNGDFKTIALATNLERGTRTGIENGYLNNILIAGWLYLGLLITISIHAIYLGFFKSRNLLSKAFAAIILIYFIDMIGFGIPELNIKYLIIWIGIGACLSQKMRSYSDATIKRIVGLK